LERFSTYWYAPFCRVCLGCCAVEFGNPGGTKNRLWPPHSPTFKVCSFRLCIIL